MNRVLFCPDIKPETPQRTSPVGDFGAFTSTIIVAASAMEMFFIITFGAFADVGYTRYFMLRGNNVTVGIVGDGAAIHVRSRCPRGFLCANLVGKGLHKAAHVAQQAASPANVSARQQFTVTVSSRWSRSPGAHAYRETRRNHVLGINDARVLSLFAS